MRADSASYAPGACTISGPTSRCRNRAGAVCPRGRSWCIMSAPPLYGRCCGSRVAARRCAGLRLRADRRQPRFRDFHILRVVAAAHADAAHDLPVDLDRVAAAEHDQPRVVDDALMQRWIVLDEVPPAIGGETEADGGVGFVLRDAHAEQGGAIHTRERLQHAALVADRD